MVKRPVGWLFPFAQPDSPVNLQPTKKDVQIGAAGHVAVPPILAGDRSKPAEKKEKVTGGNTLVAQMAFGRSDLAKLGPPTGRAHRATLGSQIGVQMSAIIAGYFSAG
jgi:hypothetical protein